MTHIHAPNQFMDNEGLTESNSLTHLLNTYDTENDEEINFCHTPNTTVQLSLVTY